MFLDLGNSNTNMPSLEKLLTCDMCGFLHTYYIYINKKCTLNEQNSILLGCTNPSAKDTVNAPINQ